MAEGNLARLGGICGLISALVMIPAYLVGYPDAPGSAAEADLYFGTELGGFVFSNGILPVFHVFFFLLFLGVLRHVLGRAEGEGGALASAAFAGGVVFIALSAAGFAAEIVYPASALRFGEFEPGSQFVYVSLALSSWLYHFCQAGASVMVGATSLVVLGTGVLPRWMVPVGLVVALLTLLHFLIPLLAALSGLLWIAIVSALMLVGVARASGGTARTRTRSSRR